MAFRSIGETDRSALAQDRSDKGGLRFGDGLEPIAKFVRQPRIIPAETRLRCRIVVCSDGSNAVFRVEYNDFPTAEQTIPLSTLPLSSAVGTARSAGNLPLRAEGLLVRLHSFRLRMLTGEAVR